MSDAVLRNELTLAFTKNIGPVRFQKLLKRYGSAERVAARAETAVRKRVDAEMRLAEKLGIQLISFSDPLYPPALKQIYDPPIVLYVKGRLPKHTEAPFAVVGSRVASLYGLNAARAISRDLAARGVIVVSGLAKGIDSAAHEGALQAGGVTVAVLAGGVDRVYPPENRGLASRILKEGAIISEQPLGTLSLPPLFPLRNRIISGLSLGILVVEAREKSGALITADLALSQGREVYAVPGNVDSVRSRGTNRLLKQGAKLVMSADDIADDLSLGKKRTPVSGRSGLQPEENTLLDVMGESVVHVDELIARSRLGSSRAITVLSLMQLKGLVQELPGQHFSRKS